MRPLPLLQRLYIGVLCLTAALIPFRFIFGAVGVGVLVGLAVLQKDVLRRIFSLRNKKGLWPWMLYFGLIALSWFWSVDKAEASFQISASVSIALLPLLVGGGPALSATQVGRTLSFFIGGVSAIGVISLVRAIWIWSHTGTTDHFFYHALLEGGITGANAVYMAWYTLFALIALVHWPIGAQTVLRSRLRMGLFLFLNIFAILLASRLLVVLLIFVDTSAFYKVIRERRHFMRNLRLGVLSCILLFLVLFLTNNPVSSRFREIRYSTKDLSASKTPLPGTEMRFDNLSLRLFLWRNGLKTVQVEHLWLQGTGAGDYTEAQKRRVMELTAEGYNLEKHQALWKINLHNAYIQALVMYGLPGLVLLLGMLLPPLLFWKKYGISNVFAGLILLSIAFMMQESVLQTQAGIVFLSLFSSVLWNFNYNWLAGRRHTVAKTLKVF